MNKKNKSISTVEEDLEFYISLRNDYFLEARERIKIAEKILLDYENNLENNLLLDDYKRILHSLKGSAKAVEENSYATLVHEVEESFLDLKDEKFFKLNFNFLDLSQQYVQAFLEDRDSEMVIKKWSGS